MTYEEAKRVISNTCIRFGRAQGKTLFLKAIKMAMEALDKQIQEGSMKNKLALEAKYTDDDVIKAAECCSKFDGDNEPACSECPFRDDLCSKIMCKAVSDLLKRQKAEIKSLYKEIERISKMTVETSVKEMSEDQQ